MDRHGRLPYPTLEVLNRHDAARIIRRSIWPRPKDTSHVVELRQCSVAATRSDSPRSMPRLITQSAGTTTRWAPAVNHRGHVRLRHRKTRRVRRPPALPSLYLQSSLPISGGSYVYMARFIHPSVAFVQSLNACIGMFNIAVMSITFAAYFVQLFPGANLNKTVVAVGCALVFAALVIVLLVGLSLWIMFSIHTEMMAK